MKIKWNDFYKSEANSDELESNKSCEENNDNNMKS